MVWALADARNRELHGDGTEIAELTAKNVMPQIYSFFVKTARHANYDLKALLGDADARQAEQVAEAIQKDRKRRVKQLIDACRDRFYTLPKGEQAALREKSKPLFKWAVQTSGHHLVHEKCPACSELGLFAGLPAGRSSPILKGQEIIEEIRIIPSAFACKCCGLRIAGLDELMAAGFPHEFYSIDTLDPLEHLGIDPMDHVNVDRIIQDYNDEMRANEWL
jgi:hypothetical protein